MRLRVLILLAGFCLAIAGATSLLLPMPAAEADPLVTSSISNLPISSLPISNLPTSQSSSPPTAANAPTTYLFIPQIANDYCGPFLDPFDDNAAVWFTGAFDGLRAEIVAGEYRLAFSGRGAVWLMPGPVCRHATYHAVVDARWDGDPGNFIGLLIGIDDVSERAYLFVINTEARVWLVFEVTGDSLNTIIAPTGHDAVLPGSATNRLAAERQGDVILLSVNDTPVGELRDAESGTPVLAGVVAAGYTHQTSADARFDNFRYEPVFGE